MKRANNETTGASFTGRGESVSIEEKQKLFWSNSNPTSEFPDKMVAVDNFQFANEENTTGATLVMKGASPVATEGNGIVFK